MGTQILGEKRDTMENFRFENGYLYCEGLRVVDIPARVPEIHSRHKGHPSPLFVYSKNQILENIQEYMAPIMQTKRSYTLNYAMKANMNPTFLSIMRERGCSVTLVSGFELQLALMLGFDPGVIVLNGNGKQTWEIELAVKNGCLLNIDSMFNLEQTINVCRVLNKEAHVLLRVNPDIDPSVHKYICTGKQGSKFGIESDQLDAVAMVIKDNPYIRLVGLHCHLGSTITDVNVYRKSAKMMLQLLKSLKEKGFHNLQFINLGGGLGIDYHRMAEQTRVNGGKTNECKTRIPRPQEIVSVIEEELQGEEVSVILEPGRSLVGNAGILATEVLGVKPAKPNSFIVVDGAMTEVLRPALYSAYHHIDLAEPSLVQPNQRETYDVVGPVCESADFLGKERYLTTPHSGCTMAVFDVGAYCATMGSNYNMRPRPAEVMVDGENIQVIRRADSLADILQPYTNTQLTLSCTC